jgi:hypothetical protein
MTSLNTGVSEIQLINARRCSSTTLCAMRDTYLSVTFSNAGTVIEIIQRIATAVIPGIDQANTYAGKSFLNRLGR